MPDPFAKLFEFDDIGQVLITKETLEVEGEDRPSIVTRVDTGSCVMTLDMKFQSDDDGWSARDRVFADVIADWAHARGSEAIDLAESLGL
ncbi:hypothetical protein [Pacificibacter marinus]|uniref:hypothetical protein n=1 Tax=Pacificibacter marinus TaxID=658057 RepID=UPI001C07C6E0|nr:hypothetical protein [Pacificibacter marinus]MBU2867029.1 hypothetical protein [Pacificibacter marinus]